jgi:hypothetical protein
VDIHRIYGKRGGDLSAEASAKVGVNPRDKILMEDGRREMEEKQRTAKSR